MDTKKKSWGHGCPSQTQNELLNSASNIIRRGPNTLCGSCGKIDGLELLKTPYGQHRC